jgi:hypothetical protein
LKLKSIEQAGRGFVRIAQRNLNLGIPSKVRGSAHLLEWKLRLEVESGGLALEASEWLPYSVQVPT